MGLVVNVPLWYWADPIWILWLYPSVKTFTNPKCFRDVVCGFLWGCIKASTNSPFSSDHFSKQRHRRCNSTTHAELEPAANQLQTWEALKSDMTIWLGELCQPHHMHSTLRQLPAPQLILLFVANIIKHTNTNGSPYLKDRAMTARQGSMGEASLLAYTPRFGQARFKSDWIQIWNQAKDVLFGKRFMSLLFGKRFMSFRWSPNQHSLPYKIVSTHTQLMIWKDMMACTSNIAFGNHDVPWGPLARHSATAASSEVFNVFLKSISSWLAASGLGFLVSFSNSAAWAGLTKTWTISLRPFKNIMGTYTEMSQNEVPFCPHTHIFKSALLQSQRVVDSKFGSTVIKVSEIFWSANNKSPI